MRKRQSKRLFPTLLVALLVIPSATGASQGSLLLNGFDISNATIPLQQIQRGGPPRDGIPAITDPVMVSAEQAGYLEDNDRVVGIEINGETRAYPIAILNWHEVINDRIGEQRLAITYCPLCGTAMAFSASIDGEDTEFGVSGLLYNSDVLLYDRKTESLWSQVIARSIAGKLVGRTLQPIPVTHTRWSAWRRQNPGTLVMSDQTGYSRDYRRNPYAGYENSPDLFFQVANRAPGDYHPKELIAGIQVDGIYRAYPFVELEKNGKSRFDDTINGKTVTIRWDGENRSVTASVAGGEPVIVIQGFWFAWYAFHPDTGIFRARNPG